LIDGNKSIIPKSFDDLRGETGIIVIALIFLFIVTYICVFVQVIIYPAGFVAVYIAFTSLVLSFSIGIKPSLEENKLIVCYKRLETSHNVENPQKPLLKALIKMRLRNPEFDLEQIYNMNPSMFSPEKLLEKLYAKV
jgi:hypothetical protein